MKARSTSSISIVFPCYNDAGSIGNLVKNANTVAKRMTLDYEIIVVDDASSDNSRAILANLASKNRRLKILFRQENGGYGAALRSGFTAASKDLVFYTDGDGQYDPKELPLLLSLITPDVDFINGIKMSRKDPTERILLGNLYSFITRWAFWIPIVDVDCDFRLMRRALLSRLNLRGNSGSICIELVKKAQRAGAKFRQVSVHHYERRFGQSQFFQPKHLITTLSELASLWFQLMIWEKLKKRL